MNNIEWLTGTLASAEATVQAEFINGFCSALVAVCKRNAGTQLWHLAEHLDASAADPLKELVDLRQYLGQGDKDA